MKAHLLLSSKATCRTFSDLITVQLICYPSILGLHIVHSPLSIHCAENAGN